MSKSLQQDIETIRDKFLPCPFCGRQPEILPWHGGGPRKVLVQCPAEYVGECPADVSVCEESLEEALAGWNQRI
jgi:hypothetical protein